MFSASRYWRIEFQSIALGEVNPFSTRVINITEKEDFLKSCNSDFFGSCVLARVQLPNIDVNYGFVL